MRTPFREAFEHGGIYLLDEVDAGNANVLTCLNAALSHGHCSFPDGVIPRHKDFLCIAAGNTWGNGASREYCGRNQLDAATLNRFVRIEWPYDALLEGAIAGNPAWTDYVQSLRAKAASLKLRVLVTPRASIYGAALLAAGFTQDEAAEMTIFAGLDTDTAAKLKGGAK